MQSPPSSPMQSPPSSLGVTGSLSLILRACDRGVANLATSALLAEAMITCSPRRSFIHESGVQPHIATPAPYPLPWRTLLPILFGPMVNGCEILAEAEPDACHLSESQDTKPDYIFWVSSRRPQSVKFL